MSQRNGIVVSIPASALLPTCGEYWIPLGDVSRLTEPDRAVLSRYAIGEKDWQEKHNIPGIMAAEPTWESAILWLRLNIAADRD
jgi:hypothetical protein